MTWCDQMIECNKVENESFDFMKGKRPAEIQDVYLEMGVWKEFRDEISPNARVRVEDFLESKNPEMIIYYYQQWVDECEKVSKQNWELCCNIKGAHIVTVKNYWKDFLNFVRTKLGYIITEDSFVPLLKCWIAWRHFTNEKIARFGNSHVAGSTLDSWARDVCKVWHIVTECTEVQAGRWRDGRKARVQLWPEWYVAKSRIQNAVELYTRAVPKFWVGEHELNVTAQAIFHTPEAVDRLRTWHDLSDIQKCWVIDRLKWEGVGREGEYIPNRATAKGVLRGDVTFMKPTVNKGLYTDNFMVGGKLNIVSGTEWGGGGRKIKVLISTNKTQKNRSAQNNNRFSNKSFYNISLETHPDLVLKFPVLEKLNTAKCFSLTLGISMEKLLGDDDIFLEPHVPLFPDKLVGRCVRTFGIVHVNVAAETVKVWRKSMYKVAGPSAMPDKNIGKISGHSYRGGRANELLGLGVPDYIVTYLGRWVSIPSMLAYLTLDPLSLGAFAAIRPSTTHDIASFSPLAWSMTYNRNISSVNDSMGKPNKTLTFPPMCRTIQRECQELKH